MRTLNAAPFVEIASDPTVRPWLGIADPKADLTEALTPIVANVANFCFLTESGHGGYIVQKLQPGLYCAHTLALPSARGKPMLSLMHQGFRFMFTATDALEITTSVPDGADAADRWAQIAGFREQFRREAFFPLLGEVVGASFRSLSYMDWVFRAPDMESIGKAFHTVLEAAGAHVNHGDDHAHDRIVGATLAGCNEGNAQKAIALYGRWAALAGYLPATILSLTPLVVDIGNAVIQHSHERLDVLSVRA